MCRSTFHFYWLRIVITFKYNEGTLIIIFNHISYPYRWSKDWLYKNMTSNLLPSFNSTQAKLDKVFICQHFMTLTFIRINSKVYVVVHLKSMWTPIWFTNYNNNYNAKINPNFLLTQKKLFFVSEYVIHWLTDKEKTQKCIVIHVHL